MSLSNFIFQTYKFSRRIFTATMASGVGSYLFQGFIKVKRNHSYSTFQGGLSTKGQHAHQGPTHTHS